ncbi:signal peptidase I [Candidatus Geothermarchaeota archaeon]|nr:MAG: signal peptidase I [Candidatus Geothermarchaeota archaeon]HEW93865.1 signal peptidase I [Thermoprotei archaeon]
MSRRIELRILYTVITLILLYLAISFGIEYVFGVDKPFMVVVSRSMEPTIRVNDLIIITKASPDDIRVGDIIVFRSPLNPDMYIVHRVIQVIRSNDRIYFKTKGDNNKYPDRWVVDQDNLIGRVLYIIPAVGGVIRVFNENILLKATFIGLLIMLLIYLEYREYMGEKESNIEKLDILDLNQ